MYTFSQAPSEGAKKSLNTSRASNIAFEAKWNRLKIFEILLRKFSTRGGRPNLLDGVYRH